KEIKPEIIMISASGSGTKGPEAGMHALAPVFGALSGLADMTGYADGEPAEIRISGDYVNSATVFFVLLAALWHCKRTGQGQFIDYSSREGLCCFIGDSFMDYTMNNRVQSRNGNRDDVMAPHNCYRCRGEDKWVSIAIATEEEWNSFCNAIGDPEWANEERFSNACNRWQNQEELDKLVGEWTIRYSPYEVMDILQKAGVAAVPSFSAQDMYTDPHLTARGFTEIVEHPKLGAAMIIRNPWRLSADPPRITSHAPLLGEHNEYVFGELLGMGKEEIARLEEAKVIW
ncbi:CaiB/BaiF CoA transferase family protein, partial [Chloroflexota bacterium]